MVLCITANLAARCPLRVKSDVFDPIRPCPLYPRKRTSERTLGDVRFVPGTTKVLRNKARLFDHLVSASE
jgi:hypothetical protein